MHGSCWVRVFGVWIVEVAFWMLDGEDRGVFFGLCRLEF